MHSWYILEGFLLSVVSGKFYHFFLYITIISKCFKAFSTNVRATECPQSHMMYICHRYLIITQSPSTEIAW